ncbi:Hypothetical predicted protein [Pelobates cultripes]|uniref:VPS9 domain-containing protein n=1 Tax=Pelobates cultripes TaxID=61616 RepID=A0AAD1R0Q3_PELCU|nr:Hypothetical predicted protein [Pelobates cultripes]
MKLDLSTRNKQGQPLCAIHVTSENGALCVINPLFLHEHGDKWLTQYSRRQVDMKRRSVPWFYDQDSGIVHDTEGFLYRVGFTLQGEQLGKQIREQIEACFSPIILAISDVANRLRTCRERDVSADRSSPRTAANCSRQVRERCNRNPVLENKENIEEQKDNTVRLSEDSKKSSEKRSSLLPHRVSWIEVVQPGEGNLQKSSSETSLNSSDSFLLPPLPELDSISMSSVEEDVDCHSLNYKRKHSHGLGDIVRHSILAVSTALTGLVSPEKYLGNRIQQLAEDPASYFGGTVQSFICNMHKGSAHNQSSIEMLQNIRQMLSNLKSYLLENNEIWEIVEHQEIDESKLAAIIEATLYKCVLKPVRNIIYTQLLDLHTKDGSLSKLLNSQEKMKAGDLNEQKPRAGLPGASAMEKIKEKLSLMHMAYSPKKMTTLLLKVCKLIYESMESSSEKKEPFGADDFLPVLIHVLIGCDLTSVQLDVEYMMELADPSELQGEGGYYLTTMFGALYHISSFNTVSRQLSTEAQNSIRQWQRRRTIHHRMGEQTSQHDKHVDWYSQCQEKGASVAACFNRYSEKNGALCVINPLFLHEHGDKWLTQYSRRQVDMKRRSVPWFYDQDSGIVHDTEDIEQDYQENTEEQKDITVRLGEGEESEHKTMKPREGTVGSSEETPGMHCFMDSSETQGSSDIVPKMRKQRISSRQMKLGSKRFQGNKQSEEVKMETESLQQKSSEKRSSLLPHRVSWIEVVQPGEGNLQKSSSETSLNSSDSFLLPPLPELDSISMSSVEEDVDCHSLNYKRKHSHGLGDIVRHSILAVSTALTGLVSPEKYLGNRIQQLAEDPASYFGGTVQSVICNMHKGSAHNQSSIEMLQNIRQMLSNLKSYLLENNEIWEIVEHQEIDESKLGMKH